MTSFVTSLSADGSTTAVDWSGGSATFTAIGSFGGGTLTVEVSLDGGSNYAPAADVSITAAGAYNISFARCKLRFTLTGATSPSITITVSQ